MFPTSSSSIFPSLSPASVEISERAAFSQALDAWRAESPCDETEARIAFIIELNQVFNKNSAFFYFKGNISSLPACIGGLTVLERLVLDCARLTSLPPEIGDLHALRSLELIHCSSLISLPPEISNLHALERLNLSSATSLASLPPEIGNLSSLKDLNLSLCTRLTSLPPQIGNLAALEVLDLSRCIRLESLPPEIGNLCTLRRLSFSNCRSLTSLPAEIGNLHVLERLCLHACAGLASLPPETITLEDLHPFEHQEFVEIFEKFLALFCRLDRRDYIQDESIASGSEVLQATGRFVKVFKERLIEKRLQNMHNELSKGSCCNSFSVERSAD